MNKFFKYNLVAFCIYFLFIVSVSAGVCDGRTVANPVDGTCNSSKTYRFKSYLHSSSGGYSVFKTVSNYSYSGVEEYALCIDPGKNSPYDSAKNPYDYNYVRDIETTGNDLYFYRIYQKYVNAVGYNYGARDEYLKQIDIMSRYLIHHEIPGWSLSGSTYDKNKLLNNASAKAFYDDAMAMTLWDNPLSFDTSVTFDTSEQMYTFKINVKFTNSTSQYFYSTSSGLINGDYNIGYGDGFFDYEFQINGGAYDFANAQSYSGNISGTINKWVSNPNNTLSFEMKMTRERYEEIFAAQGKVYLNLKYSTYNAMSDENVIFVKRHAASSTNQRMLVFTKYVKNGNISIDGEDNEEVFASPLCKQSGNTFYYNEVPITINEYKEKCGCASINEPTITNTSIKNVYSTLCGISTSENFTSTMNTCDSDSGSNTLTHNYTQKIDTTNNYCSLECTETVNVSDLTDRYNVLAGKYFELDKYPSLNSSKNCKVNVSYNNWKNDYQSLLNDEINAVNNYLRDYAIENASWVRTTRCGSEETGYSYGDLWSFQYKKYYYNSSTRNISYYNSGRYYYETGDCRNTKPSTNISGHYSSILTRISELNTHFTRLRTCNKYLNNLGTSYYQFTGNLNFYYNQTYSKMGSIWNNNKPDGEDDDSSYTIKLKNGSGYSSGYKENSGTTYNSYQYINDSYPYIYISSVSSTDAFTSNSLIGSYQYNNYEITRIREFASSYEPSVPKYVDSYTGIISSNSSSLKNPVSIIGTVKDNVYDTNVSAIAKTNNQNYYQFSTLGDNNKIGQHYNNYNVEKLKRYCTYEITNNIIEGCEDGTCESKLDIVFRIVDPNNIDPNGRLGTGDGFKNWNNIKGQTVLSTIQSDDTYNPNNLEYSFTLDSASIKKIREYNSNCDASGNCDPITYSVTDRLYSKLSCNDEGNECTSKFIEELSKNSGYFGNKIATVTKGSDSWRYLDYNVTNGYFVNVFEKDEISYSTLINRLKLGGEEVLP